MSIPLNKRQRTWIAAFLEAHHNCDLVKRHDATCGYWQLWFEYQVNMPEILIPDCIPGSGWEIIEHFIELTPSATVRESETKVVEIVYPSCTLDYTAELAAYSAQKKEGQLSLPLPIVEKSSVSKAKRTSRKKKRDEGRQLELPVEGLAKDLFEIRHRKTGHIYSSQELLEEKVEHYVLNLRVTVRVHQGLIDLLLEKRCSHEEWESAIWLYEVAGPPCAIAYVQEIEYSRQMKKSQGLAPVVHRVVSSVEEFQQQNQRLKVDIEF